MPRARERRRAAPQTPPACSLRVLARRTAELWKIELSRSRINGEDAAWAAVCWLAGSTVVPNEREFSQLLTPAWAACNSMTIFAAREWRV